MQASWTNAVISALGQLGCKHQWIRARWDDGSYGLRCSQCMKPHKQTLTELIRQPHLVAGARRPRNYTAAEPASWAARIRQANEARG